MAQINKIGNIISACPNCAGSTSTYEYASNTGEFGKITSVYTMGYPYSRDMYVQFRLFRCAGCGRGGLGEVLMNDHNVFPSDIVKLLKFYPTSSNRLKLPKLTPTGINAEFREGEACLENNCYRAAAAMFRSVLDKTLKQNGYKSDNYTSLKKQIDSASDDGTITQARKKRAHDEIRVLGNDVLHDDWQEIKEEDVELARHYAQRILEDFYDDRETVEKILEEKGRLEPEASQEETPTKQPEQA